MDVQIEGSAESLHDGHGAAAPTHDAGLAGHVAQEAKDRPHVHPDDCAAQVVIPRPARSADDAAD